MKRLLMIVLSLVVVGVIGYVIFLLLFQDTSTSSVSSGGEVDLSSGNQKISEWREEGQDRYFC